ncbi:MAG TPA: TIGR03621 family F420-dependent LLM class oxidoreductase [Dehalococcoidia bacterium]|nr:TIGR03621 family F420-dependent LLM class oxidoreductase [Dehalococcoidia bacterium]
MLSRPLRFALQSFVASSADDWRQKAKKAEDLGYSTFHLADHYIGPGPALESTGHPAQEVAAVPAIAVAAEATSTIRVGCRVFCVDYHHPVVLAKEAATLDFFSGGRLELGLGAGWLRGEYEAMDVPYDPPLERIDRLAELIEIVKGHSSGSLLSVEGQRWTVKGFSGLPSPIQKPHPPIMVGGGSKKVLQLGAREADIVSLNFNNRAGMIGPDGIKTSTAEKTAHKISWIREAAGDRLANMDIEIGAYFTVVTDQADAAASAMAGNFGISPEEMKRHPHALMGSVDEICDEILRRREEYGINYVTVSDGNLEPFAPVVARLSGS